MATVFMSVAARLSDLDDQKPGINFQTEGHILTPPVAEMALKIQRHLEVPHHIHHLSLQQRNQHLISPETWYCLEIKVTSTTDERATPPPPHTWQAPIVEDMVQDDKSGLTEAIVTSPGRAILFCGQ